MAVLPTDYTDSTTPTGATTEYPATTTRGLNATHTQINTNTTALASAATLTGAEILTNKTIDGSSNTITVGQVRAVRGMSDGAETYTIASGSVTQITGTTINGGTLAPSVGDRILISGAPAATGVGSFLTSQPANGIYTVTGNTTNLTLSRAADMSGALSPIGRSVLVTEAWYNGYLFYVKSPTAPLSTFTYGTTAMQWSPNGIDSPVGTYWGQTLTNKTISGASNTLSSIPSTAITGLTGGNTSTQSQAVVSATAYYVTGSAITFPTNVAVGSRFRWTIALAKTAAGTGTFQIRIYRGTNGTTADTADVTQTIGTQTAAVDNMTVDVEIVVTATGATGSYFWAIIPMNKAVTVTGFGVATGPGGQFSGTVSSVAMNTASLKFGLSFIATTGTPTITVPLVRAQAYV